MAMGRSDAVRDDLMATWAEMSRSPGHAFYDRLHDLLGKPGSTRSLKGCASRITRRGCPCGRQRPAHSLEVDARPSS
jgi:hypothetical protein